MNSKISLYKTKVWLVALFIALITVLVYLPALQNGFVNLDDDGYVYKNHHIQSIDFKFFKWIFTTFLTANWHPLTWLSHAVDYAVWGLNPMGHHLTSIIFHGLNTFLVVILIIRLIDYAYLTLPPTIKGTHSIIAGAVTGLLFGIHPIHVESVAWVSERKDVLYAFFFLLSILCYLKYTSSLLKKQKNLNYSLCLLFFILSLMSKPMAVTLPAVLIILDFYPLGRLHLKSAFMSRRMVLIEKLPFLILSLASSVVTVIAHQKVIIPFDINPLGKRLLIVILAPVFYLFKMLWPTNLAPIYPYPSKISFLTIEYMGALILLVCITVFCIWSWKKQKAFLVIWGYYVVSLLPVLGIIRVGSQMAADRYTYLPSLGPFLWTGLAAVFVCKGLENRQKNIPKSIKLSLSFASIPIIIILTITTVNQIGLWKNPLTLWNHELKLFPHSVIGYLARGLFYADSGQQQRAIQDFDKALMIYPDPDIYYARGVAYGNLGKHQQAIDDFNKTIKLVPNSKEAYHNRAKAYLMLGNYQEAILNFNKAIELDPKSEEFYYDRRLAYQLAIEDYSEAIQKNPKKIEPYIYRGFSFFMIGQFDQALEDFNKVIYLNPDLSIGYYNRGLFYLNSDNRQAGIKDFQTAAHMGNKQAQGYLKSEGIGW
jgi:Flp pilus assembly protein TadD